MNDIVRRAIQYNQEGADAWSRGDLGTALASFNLALRTMVSFEPAAGTLPYAPGLTLQDVNMHSFAAMGIVQVPSCTIYSKCGPANEPFTYKKPFAFDPSLLPRTTDGVAVFSAIAVFNMAVVFHLRCQMENNCTVLRTKAVNLYEASVDLFSKVNAQFDLSGAISLALNNKASLLFLEDDYESSDRELTRLQMYMARAEHSLSTGAIMEAQDFQEILLNLMTMMKPDIAQAA